MTLLDLLDYSWCLFLGVWVITAFATKRAARIEAPWQTGTRVILTGLMLYFLYFNPPRVAWLHWQLVPRTEAWQVTGVVLTLVGIAFAIWARFALGSNWSAKVTIKRDHQLIVRGPYRIVRNPIYTGIFLAVIGTAVALGQVRQFLPLPLMFSLWIWKTMGEQRLLREQFGEEYVRYCRNVKAFIPYVL